MDSSITKKNVKNSFDFIDFFEKSNELTIDSTEQTLNGIAAKTYRVGKEFFIALHIKKVLDQQKADKFFRSDVKFKAYNKSMNIILDFNSFANISKDYNKNPFEYHCKIRKYHNQEIFLPENNYFRLIIPIQKQQKHGGIFQSEAYQLENCKHLSGLVSIKITNQLFHLYFFRNKKEDKLHLFIDSLTKTQFEEFISNINSILISYAFVTGKLPRDKRYILSSDDPDFVHNKGLLFETLPKSLNSTLSVFPSDEYRIYFGLPNKMNFQQHDFNNLCEMMVNNTDLSRVLFLLVEGHTLSTELQAAVYSVALEAITNIISKENESNFIPIPDKNFAKEIIEELNEVIEKHPADKYNKIDGKETIRRKISGINSSTNNQKLHKPFELFGIKLKKKEIEAIAKRNVFLHGRLPYSVIDEDYKFNLQQISYTILFCVTSLILKYIGYNGYVMYYPTLNEISKKKEITDYLIKKI